MTSSQGNIEASASAGSSKSLSALENMTIVDLKQELGRFKLKKSGNKADLVARLQAALNLEAERENESVGDTDVTYDDEDHDTTIKFGGRMKKVSVRETLLTFRDVEETIPFFTGDDGISIHRWLEEFEEASALCGWTSVQKIIYAKRLLKGSAKIFVRHEKCDRSWSSFKKALKEEFSETVNSGMIHKKLIERKKKHDETYQEYVYSMLDIASQANVETDAVIQYIIDGIEDEETNKTILYGTRSIRELKEKFRIYETMKRNARTKARYAGEKKMPVQSQKTSSGIRRCFTCGSRNHPSAECPTKDKGVKCFKCQEYGHFASKCTAKAPVNVCDVAEQHKKTEKEVFVASKAITALIDTGSDLSLIRAEQYVQVGAPRLSKNTMNFRGIGASENSTLGEFITEIEIDNKMYSIKLHVVSDTLLPYGMLIGTDFLNTVEVRMKNGNITIHENERESTVPEVFHISTCENNNELDLSYISNNDHRKRIQELKEKYTPNKVRDLDIKMNIELTDNIPVYERPRRVSPSEKKEVNVQINEWLENQIIQESQSNYASPIVLVKKKNGSTRLCIDFRKLNDKIVKDRYPLPLIEDHLDRLQDARIFSTLDLKNGFFHVEIEKNSRKYTAFVTPDGQYEFLRVPFGLCNSPSVFQRYINAIFQELIAKGFVLIYMDDLVIPSGDCVEGLHKLENSVSSSIKRAQSEDSEIRHIIRAINQHVLVTTAVPRGNGQVERVNRILIPLLTKLTSPKPEGWYKHLDKAQKYLNSTPSRSTEEAPFKILFGTSMKIKEDPEMRKMIDEEWLAEFEENRNEIRREAKENILKVQAANRRNFKKKRKEALKYRVGDLVAIKRMQPTAHRKFSTKFLGPYVVQNVLRNDRYLVGKDGEGEGPQRTSTSADNMKPWVTFDEENVESQGENEEEDEILLEDNI